MTEDGVPQNGEVYTIRRLGQSVAEEAHGASHIDNKQLITMSIAANPDIERDVWGFVEIFMRPRL